MYDNNPATYVSIATSSDENHSPENMIDGLPNTFWTTTGRYPQEFVLSFNSPRSIGRVKLETVNVKTLKVETATGTEPENFEESCSKEAPESEAGVLQTFEMSLSSDNATHLRFVIKDAYDHFCCVKHVEVH